MAGVNASLQAYIWSSKPQVQQEKREIWQLNGATYQGFREYLMKVKAEGWPETEAQPLADAIELARRPTPIAQQLTAAAADNVGGEAQPTTPQLRSVQTSAAAASAAAGDGSQAALGPAYAPLHVFSAAQAAVSVVRFAPCSSDLLAWGGADGSVYVATAEAPPRLLQVLEAHSDRVTDLAWTPDASALLTCSADGTACLWRPEAGVLIRTLRNRSGALACCRFHDGNPNLLLLGTAAGEVLAANASTGRLVARADLQAAPMSGVGAVSLQPAGDGRFLVADSRGCLHLYACAAAPAPGQPPRLQQLAWFPAPGGRFHEPVCLEFAAHSPLAGGPAVLLVLSSGEVALCRLLEKPWRLEVVREVHTQQASAKVQVSLRPGVAREAPELLLAGSESGTVHLLDVSQREQPPRLVAALHAHTAPVLGVAWSEDESRLASSDKRGVVVLWQLQEEAGERSPAAEDAAASPPHASLLQRPSTA